MMATELWPQLTAAAVSREMGVPKGELGHGLRLFGGCF